MRAVTGPQTAATCASGATTGGTIDPLPLLPCEASCSQLASMELGDSQENVIEGYRSPSQEVQLQSNDNVEGLAKQYAKDS